MSKIEKAWEAFFKGEEIEDLAELKKQGWLTSEEMSEIIGISVIIGKQRFARDMRLEKKQARVIWKNRRRVILLFRPKA